MSQRELVFREAEVRQILRRAAELDAEGAGALDAAALRAAAAEVGISADAVEQALAEHRQAVYEQAAPRRPRRPWWRHPLAMVAGAGALLYLAFVAAFVVYGLSMGMGVVETLRELFDLQ